MVGAKIGWKLVLAVFTMVVGLVANKALTTAWKIGSGGAPPKGTRYADVVTWTVAGGPPRGNKAGYVETITWAVASGAAAAAAKRFAEERAAQYWLRSTGHLPPGYEDEPTDLVKDGKHLVADKAQA